MTLDGKIAVITGAASGIGAAAARLFAGAGATLALVDRDADRLQAMAAELPGALTLAGDVGDEATVDAHASAILERHGRIDVLLTCAGWSSGLKVIDCDLASWEAVIRTNLTGTFLWARAAARAMREQGDGGSIIFIGSQLAFAGFGGNAAYLASKGAVATLARSMAVDHAHEGIRVNTVVPGAIDTPLLHRAMDRTPDPEAARARSMGRHAMGRFGRPEEVAKAALFLAGPDSSFTTGSCLMVEGGWLAA